MTSCLLNTSAVASRAGFAASAWCRVVLVSLFILHLFIFQKPETFLGHILTRPFWEVVVCLKTKKDQVSCAVLGAEL